MGMTPKKFSITLIVALIIAIIVGCSESFDHGIDSGTKLIALGAFFGAMLMGCPGTWLINKFCQK